MTAALARQHYGLTLGVLVLSALAYALAQTMVAPALPAIQEDLGTTTTTVTFVLTAYLLTASVATPIVGRLGDMFGKERLLLITLICFAAGSLICALSHSIGLLIAGRAVQGVGGAVFPLAFGIIRDEFPPERVATGIGLISATFGIGGGAGLVLSGLIVDHLAYEWIFWLALVFVVIAIVATHLFVPESPIKSPAKIDWVGAGLLSVGLAALLIGVSEGASWGWSDARIVGMFGGAAAVLCAWVVWERRVPQPLVDMRMMAERGVWTTNLTGLLVGFGMFGSFILIPRFVQVDPRGVRLRVRRDRHRGRDLPPPLGPGDAVRRPDLGLARDPVRLEAAPPAGHRRLHRELHLPRGRALRALGDLRRDDADGSRHRARLRGDGEPDRRGGRPHQDLGRHRDEHDHAHDRRLPRRPDHRLRRRRPRDRRHRRARPSPASPSPSRSRPSASAAAFCASLAIPSRLPYAARPAAAARPSYGGGVAGRAAVRGTADRSARAVTSLLLCARNVDARRFSARR